MVSDFLSAKTTETLQELVDAVDDSNVDFSLRVLVDRSEAKTMDVGGIHNNLDIEWGL